MLLGSGQHAAELTCKFTTQWCDFFPSQGSEWELALALLFAMSTTATATWKSRAVCSSSCLRCLPRLQAASILQVITYNAAITACEKAGSWEMAVALLDCNVRWAFSARSSCPLWLKTTIDYLRSSEIETNWTPFESPSKQKGTPCKGVAVWRKQNCGAHKPA